MWDTHYLSTTLVIHIYKKNSPFMAMGVTMHTTNADIKSYLLNALVRLTLIRLIALIFMVVLVLRFQKL